MAVFDIKKPHNFVPFIKRKHSMMFLKISFSSLVFAFFAFSGFAQTMTINGAGATFPYPIYSKWISEYEKVDSSVRFNYQSIGSGGGVRQIINQTVDFGASDDPMSDADLASALEKGAELRHIPMVIGSVTVAYNLPELGGLLKLDGETLALIFNRKITKWNDARLKSLNPELNLPNQDIMVVRRADGSGTTAVFADFLATASADWNKAPGRGKSLRWSSGTIGARGNEGVTAMVKQSVGAIGYIELAYAIQNDLPTALIKNRAGEFQAATPESVAKAADTDMDYSGDLRLNIIHAEGPGVYPISAFTYILIPNDGSSERQQAVRKFLAWAVTQGQQYTTDLHYAPLPERLQKIITTYLQSEPKG
jgi:phosphate transport system substrate-binding protein